MKILSNLIHFKKKEEATKGSEIPQLSLLSSIEMCHKSKGNQEFLTIQDLQNKKKKLQDKQRKKNIILAVLLLIF